MMQLDDVVETVSKDTARNKLATERSIRWLDRAYKYLLEAENQQPEKSEEPEAKKPKPDTSKSPKIASQVNFDTSPISFERQHDVILKDRPEQVLYPITQGVLDPVLRDYCLDELVDDPNRSKKIEGGAIGGLSGGEEKPDFSRVVLQSTARLPEYRPRYVMGIGHPIDILLCISYGCDQFDCVWPTRIARMGIALVRDSRRELNLKRETAFDDVNFKLDPKCTCSTCQNYTLPYIKTLFTNKDPTACSLLSVHNLHHHKQLLTEIREHIEAGTFPEFVNTYLNQVDYFPEWAVEAFAKVGIQVGKNPE